MSPARKFQDAARRCAPAGAARALFRPLPTNWQMAATAASRSRSPRSTRSRIAGVVATTLVSERHRNRVEGHRLWCREQSPVAIGAMMDGMHCVRARAQRPGRLRPRWLQRWPHRSRRVSRGAAPGIAGSARFDWARAASAAAGRRNPTQTTHANRRMNFGIVSRHTLTACGGRSTLNFGERGGFRLAAGGLEMDNVVRMNR